MRLHFFNSAVIANSKTDYFNSWPHNQMHNKWKWIVPMHVYLTQANSPLSLIVKLKISEVSKNYFPRQYSWNEYPRTKKCKRKHFSSQTSLGVKFTRPSVIMKKGLLKLLDIIWKIDHILDHRNDVIKFSKLKWNHEPQTSGFTAKLWTFYGVISMVYKSVDHGKLLSIGFYNNIFFYEKPKTKQPALRDMLRYFHGLYSHRP